MNNNNNNNNLIDQLMQLDSSMQDQAQTYEQIKPFDSVNNNNFISNSSNKNDELLKKAFIGNNYDKLTTKLFNWSGFFFTTLYMFYRKMFLYGLIFFIINFIVINFINNFFVNLIFWIASGMSVNILYSIHVDKKLTKIKEENPGARFEELRSICASKGGTSIGLVFGGFFTEIIIALVASFIMIMVGIGSIFGNLLNSDNWNIILSGDKININNNSLLNKKGDLLENVNIGGHSCFNSKCTVSIEESGEYVDYIFDANNIDLFSLLDDYTDFIRVDIYYTKKGSDKTINDYKIYLKSTNKEIKNVKNEGDLRNALGLYSIGTHTDTFTVTKVGSIGAGFDDNSSYTFIDYKLVDSKNNEYEMTYIQSSSSVKLVEGKKYNITFEVVEGVFKYEFYIKKVN